MNTWRVGRAYAALKLRELDGVFGGELAGHYYFRDFFYSDSGLLAAILILNVVAKMKAQGISLSQLIARIEKYQNSGEINFKIERKKEAMDAVRDYFMSTEKATAYMDFDGYRVEFPDWWFNIRPSNTEPYLRFLCEATSKELLDEKVAKVREIVEQLTSLNAIDQVNKRDRGKALRTLAGKNIVAKMTGKWEDPDVRLAILPSIVCALSPDKTKAVAQMLTASKETQEEEVDES